MKSISWFEFVVKLLSRTVSFEKWVNKRVIHRGKKLFVQKTSNVSVQFVDTFKKEELVSCTSMLENRKSSVYTILVVFYL